MRERFQHRLKIMDVRQMCIANDYYTAGDCQAYMNMFEMFSDIDTDVTPQLLREVAKDIKEHSHTEDEVFDIYMNLVRLVKVQILIEMDLEK